MKPILIILLALGPFVILQQSLRDHRLYQHQQIGQVKHVISGDQPTPVSGSGHKR